MLHACFSNKKEFYFPITEKGKNQGATRLIPQNQMTKQLKPFISGNLVESITLQDLINYSGSSTVIIKMDIEVNQELKSKKERNINDTLQGFECLVLEHYFSSPVKGTFIPYIFMEWRHIQINKFNNCPNLTGLVKLFTENGYKPWNIETNIQLDVSGTFTLQF